MKTQILKITLLCFVLFMACSKQENLTPSADDQKLEQLGKEIQDFAKNKTCAGGDDCKTMAMGSKACGGPTSYIVYALSKTDEKQLSEKVKQYTDFQKELNIKYNRTSDCLFLSPPTVDCLNGVCASK
jgi:Fe-S-cluster containining protein